MRDKWERDAYRNRTLDKAIAGCMEVYDPAQGVTEPLPASPPPAQITTPNGTLKLLFEERSKTQCAVILRDAEGNTAASDVGNMERVKTRQNTAKALAEKLGVEPKDLAKALEESWLRQADFQRRLQEAMVQRLAAAKDVPPETLDQRDQRLFEDMPKEVRREAEKFLRQPKMLERIADDIEAFGVAGERELAVALYLVCTSRKLHKPLAARIIGPSSSGKSHTQERVCSLMPPEGVLVVTDITPNALYYSPDNFLKHVAITAGERGRGREEDVAESTRALRQLLSEGRISKLMPVKMPDGSLVSERIEKEGPVAYIESTTKGGIFSEDYNRALCLYTDERTQQTEEVLAKQAAEAEGKVDADPGRIRQKHWAVQRLLRQREVVVPFAWSVLRRLHKDRVEVRRGARYLLEMIKAITLLHQYRRKTDDEGRLIATEHDYAMARRLMEGPLTRLFGSGVADATLRFYERMRRKFEDNTFTSTQARMKEKHSKAAVNGWLRELHEEGFVELVAPGRGNLPAVWKLTEINADEMPSTLPQPNEVFAAAD
jgi:hypothetical protein